MHKKLKNLGFALIIVSIAIIGIVLLSGCITSGPKISDAVLCSNITDTNFAVAQPDLNTTSNTFYENSPIYVCANITTSINGNVLKIRVLNLSNYEGENLSNAPVITSLNWEEDYVLNGKWRCHELSTLKAGKYAVRVILGENENEKQVDILLKLNVLNYSISHSPDSMNHSSEKFCSVDSDCACGVHIKTGKCFYGNKNFVDTSKQCPDFCSGVTGKFEIKCIDGECKQIEILPNDAHTKPTVNDNHSKPTQTPTNVVEANNKFAFDLYSKLNDENNNIFFSPYSISTALSMTYEGARGKTADEMKNVLHLPDDKEKIHSEFKNIYNELNKASKSYNLSVANALWAQKDYKFLDEYFKTIERYYDGKVTNLDFIKETEKSRQIINEWVENQTNNKIKDLIPSGVLNPMTRLVITNAIYFKGTWKWEFDKNDTREMNFYVNSTNTVKAQMMSMKPEKARFNYTETDKLQILELPYKGDKISMLILLPKQGKEYDYRTEKTITYNYTLKGINLSYENLKKWKSQMKETKLEEIYIPKFKLETKYFMNKILSDMGMPTAFSGDADFSGMTGNKDLFIGHVIHQAYVDVNEEGTEAAAATAVVMYELSMEPTNIFKADHPFVFIIQDKETGNILFMGRVVDPTHN